MKAPALTPGAVTGYQKIATVSVPVPIQKPGNTEGHLLTFFEVYADGPEYLAVMLSGWPHKTLTHLPGTIPFHVKEGAAVDIIEAYQHVVEGIITELRKQGHL